MTQQGSRVGQQLGNYQLERLLGRGGFAEVYRGYHLRLRRQAAIKVLYAYLSEREVEEFQREAQIIANLDHPNIVRILDFDVQQGVPFLVMDYLPNGTLRQHHAKGERVPLPTVVAYVKQIADALQYAHDQRLIHRDVKPENMLIGRRNDIVLSDFGIAAIAHGTSSMTAQTTAGTIYYMAPEQIQSHARPASDQYALAVVVYEWLSGVRPFEGSYTEIFAKHLMTPPPPLRQHIPELSPEVEQVIFTALAKEPGQRFGRVQAFATALEAASQPAAQFAAPTIRVTSLPAPQPSEPPAQMIEEMRKAQRSQALAPPPLPLPILSSSTSVFSVSWSPDSTYIATGGFDNTVQIWNAAYGDNILAYKGHSGPVMSVNWSPYGKSIASGGRDNTVQIWNAAYGDNIFTYKGHSGPVRSVAWSPDGKRIASGGRDNTVQIWDATDGNNVITYKGHSASVNAVAWFPDGTRIALGSLANAVQVLNATDGNTIFTYKGHSDFVWSVACSPDGVRIASGSNDNTVQVWNAIDGNDVVTYRGHSHPVNAVAWSPNGMLIASADANGIVQVWDAAHKRDVFTYRGHSSFATAVAWSPDGTRIASADENGTVRVWTPQ